MKRRKSNLTKKIERFFDKLATICGGYAEMGVIVMVSTIGCMASIFLLIDADKIFVLAAIILMIIFAYLGKRWISK